MDITTILNRKNSAAAAAAVAAEAQLQQQFIPSPSSPRMKHEPGPEPVDPPALSYSPHPLGQMANPPQDMRYPQQHPGNSLPTIQSPYFPASYPNSAQVPNGAPDGRPGDAPPKTFHCSSCGKGFARRSDLARHGESCVLFLFKSRRN
jgi:hypothetical protein